MSKIEIGFDGETIAVLKEAVVAMETLATALGDREVEETEETEEADEPEAKPAKKKAAKKKAAKKGPTVEEVRKTLKDYAAIEGKDAAIEILNETGGAASVGELDEDKYQAVIDKCNEDDGKEED